MGCRRLRTLQQGALLLAVAVALGGGRRAKAQLVAQAERYDPFHAWTVEARASSVYYPNADQGLSQRPFHEVFGGKHRFYTELQIDRDLWSPFGTISVGLASGYVEFYGQSYVQDSSLGLVQVADRANFHMVPMRLLVTYRFDPFLQRGIPLVPFVRLGPEWIYYWAALGNGKTSVDTATQARGEGLTSGVEGTIGLSFLLDVLDPGTARSFYQTIGVAHTYVVAGYTAQVIKNGPDGLFYSITHGGRSAPPAIDLSASFFDFGIGFQF